MEYLNSLLESSSTPIVIAFLLGLITAISPCPLATNITAIGYISRDLENKNRMFLGGLLYTLGRVITYTVLGFILIPILREGSSMFSIQKTLSNYGEMLIAPVLIVVGLFMLFGNKLNLPKIGISGERVKMGGGIGALLLGMLFALAFCPTSGVFYFGMLIPMAAAEAGGYYLPVVFALATGLPVVLVAWVLAYSVSSVGKVYNKIQTIQRWTTKIVAFLFIIVGVYYGIMYYL